MGIDDSVGKCSRYFRKWQGF